MLTRNQLPMQLHDTHGCHIHGCVCAQAAKRWLLLLNVCLANGLHPQISSACCVVPRTYTAAAGHFWGDLLVSASSPHTVHPSAYCKTCMLTSRASC